MKVKISYDGPLASFELIPETTLEKICIDTVGPAETAIIKRNGTLTFSVKVATSEIGKAQMSKDDING